MSAFDPKRTFWSATLTCQQRWQAQLFIEIGATEPFEIVLSLAVVFDGHLLRDTRCPFMTVSVDLHAIIAGIICDDLIATIGTVGS